MNIKFFTLTNVFLIFSCFWSYSQVIFDKFPVVIPASPNAAELGKYGGVDIGLPTGAINIQLPIHSIDQGNTQIPINLQYSTTGIKVDQLASRVGLGWAFGCGGVIVRNVNGKPDEISTRSLLPSNWNSFDQNFLDYLWDVTGSNPDDSQPDEFMFNFGNGYTGKFVFDSNLQPILISHSNLKITFHFIDKEHSSFSIVTPDGNKYEFAAIELTSVNTIGVGLDSQVASRVPTSWYLSKVTLANHDVIDFNYLDNIYEYQSSISQLLVRSQSSFQEAGCGSVFCGDINENKVFRTSVLSWGKLLDNISCKSSTIYFSYIDRTDVNKPNPSVTGEMLLSKIRIFNSDDSLLKSFLLDYEYGITGLTNPYTQDNSLKFRPYLKSLTETDTSSQVLKKHSFKYEDIQGLPQRLSFSQDFEGYFNNKSNVNFVPIPTSNEDQQLFTNATANRNYDLNAAIKGSLRKIIYPTGGSDSIVYSLNNVDAIQSQPAQNQIISVIIQSNPNSPIIKTSPAFSINYGLSNVKLNGGILVLTDANNQSPEVPSDVDLMQTELIKLSDMSVVYTKTLKLGETISNVLVSNLEAGVQYQIKVTSFYPNIRCNTSITYLSGPPTNILVNKNVGGLRVEKVITQNLNSSPQIKKYFYTYLEDRLKSSGKEGPSNLFFTNENYILSGFCNEASHPGSYTTPVLLTCKKKNAYSSSQINPFVFSQSRVYYENVIESIGENFENGGVNHRYFVERDQLSHPFLGTYSILGVKNSNTGWRNGLEKEQFTFKMLGNVPIGEKMIKKTYVSACLSPPVNCSEKTVQGYYIVKHYDFPHSYSPPINPQFEGYEASSYKFYSRWIYNDTLVVTEFNKEGQPSTVSTIINKYDNPDHTLITSTSTKNSKGESIDEFYLYPHEMVSLGLDVNGVYQGMIDKHILSPKIRQTIKNNGIQISSEWTNYFMPYIDIFVPKDINYQTLINAPVQKKINFLKYDTKGNMLSLSKEGGVITNYIWSYKESYPIAEIKNIGYESIENILGAANISTFADQNPSKLNVDSFIAPLKIALPNSHMTTYTYKPLVGMTSMTDARNQTTYYEYDGFQRLKAVKDNEGNILKATDYHYKTPTP